MKKRKFFDVRNALVTAKAWVVGIVSTVVIAIPAYIVRYIWRIMELPIVAGILGVLTLISYALLWGKLANMFWGWK